jgi:hypothetical protein
VAFRIARAAVEVFLDRDALPAEMAALERQLQSDTDRVGRSSGKRLGKGLGDGTDGASVGRKVAADVDKELQPRAEKSGRDSGDKLSRGMQLAMVRNSPMIAAAVAGGLMLGAPAVIAAAGALFVGLAAVFASSSEDLKATWAKTTSSMVATLDSAAQVAVPMFQQALHRLADSVVILKPQFQSMFESLGAPIDSLTTGLISMTNNVMPGLIAAVRAAGPVFQGLSSFLASLGTGLGDFFTILSAHSGSAQQVFASLGQILQSLLPILGDLIGAGADLAADVLPGVAGAFKVVATVIDAIKPALPALIAGFVALQVAGPVSGLMQKLSGALGGAAEKMGGASQSGGVLSTVLQTASDTIGDLADKAGPILGVVVTGLTAMMERASEQTDQWAQALIDGGRAAADAQSQMGNFGSAMKETNTGFGGFVANMVGLGASFGMTAKAIGDTKGRVKELYDAMSPLQRAQQDVTTASNDLQLAIDKYGPSSGQAAGASVELKQKQDDLAAAQAKLELATHGVTQAMIDQADQARAGIDSLFGMQHAQEQQRQAQADLLKVMQDSKSTFADQVDAQNHYAEAVYRSASANAQYQADMSGLKKGSLEYQQFLDSKLLVTLQDISNTMTGPAKDAIDRFIEQLKAAGVTTDVTGKKLDDLGDKNPTPTVDLNTKPIDGGIADLNSDLGVLASQHPTPTADLNPRPFSEVLGSLSGSLAWLSSQNPTPLAGLNAAPFQFAAGQTAGTMSYLAHLSANPIAYLTALTRDAEYALNYTARTRYATIYATVAGGAGFMGMAASGGQVGAVVGPGFAGGGIFSGRVFGPGGPRDDMVQAITTAGMPLRVSNREWVINADVSERQGGRRMAALNAGQADIVPRGRRFADGGTEGATAGGITVQSLTVNVSGVLDFADPGAARQVAVGVRDALIRLDREQH